MPPDTTETAGPPQAKIIPMTPLDRWRWVMGIDGLSPIQFSVLNQDRLPRRRGWGMAVCVRYGAAMGGQ